MNCWFLWNLHTKRQYEFSRTDHKYVRVGLKKGLKFTSKNESFPLEMTELSDLEGGEKLKMDTN